MSPLVELALIEHTKVLIPSRFNGFPFTVAARFGAKVLSIAAMHALSERASKTSRIWFSDQTVKDGNAAELALLDDSAWYCIVIASKM